MNPQEKATQLVGKFWYVKPLESCDGMEYKMAIDCALIAVDEIVNAIAFDFENTSKDTVYWLKVKQEINKLNK